METPRAWILEGKGCSAHGLGSKPKIHCMLMGDDPAWITSRFLVSTAISENRRKMSTCVSRAGYQRHSHPHTRFLDSGASFRHDAAELSTAVDLHLAYKLGPKEQKLSLRRLCVRSTDLYFVCQIPPRDV